MATREQKICNWIGGYVLSERADRMLADTEMRVIAEMLGKYYDNGDYCGMVEAADEYAEEIGMVNYFPAMVALMDDEIREDIAAEYPNTESEFLAEYKARHLAKYGEDFCF